MPTIRLPDRFDLYYEDPNPGSSRPVLLIHGLGCTARSWDLQIPPLIQAGLRPIIPECRGFGRSGYPGYTGITEMADDLGYLLQALHVPKTHVAGISMGGIIAQQLTLDTPHLVRTLTLINTYAYLQPNGISGMLYFGVRFVLVHTLGLRIQARTVARRVFPHPGQEAMRQELYNQIVQSNPAAYRATLRALARFNSRSRLSALRVPALVISGSNDSTVALSDQRRLAALIPGSRHIVIQGAGHGVTGEKPAEFTQAFLEFLTA